MTTTHYQSHRVTLMILACFFLLVNNLAAQQKFSVALTGGPSFPTGRFGNQVDAGPTSFLLIDGGARPGWNGNLELSAALTSHVWITLSGGLSGFKGKNESIEKTLRAIYGYDSKADAGTWNILKIVAGPSLRLSLGRKLTIRPSVAAGIAKTAIPAVIFTTYNQEGNTLMTMRHDRIKTTAGFAYQAELGWSYKLGKQLSLVADVHFLGTRTKYVYKTLNLSGDRSDLSKYEYPLNNCSVAAGIEFSF
ncbi:MAG: hypothetical protein DI535_21475 [Citrobacter freundii]|nr:MAG: hypothetical protein DI535_21475 [Citrobacter freundii]